MKSFAYKCQSLYLKIFQVQESFLLLLKYKTSLFLNRLFLSSQRQDNNLHVYLEIFQLRNLYKRLLNGSFWPLTLPIFFQDLQVILHLWSSKRLHFNSQFNVYHKKYKISFLALLIFQFLSFSIHAKDLGVYGQTFPIHEENLLIVIQQKLQTLEQTGEISQHQQTLARKARTKFQNPMAVEGIRTTTFARTWTYDPSLKVQQDIKDHQGKVIVPQGTILNPLENISWGAPLLFLDSDDSQQIVWAGSQDSESKWVLIKGRPLDLEEKIKRPIYFDQAGLLTRKFGIQQVPCRITQQGKVLRVEEIKLPEPRHE